MDFKIGRINLNAVAQGVGGLVFGNENSASSEDSYVGRLLDRISNGVLPEDRRAAIAELQSIVAESRSAQLAFGATGFPVLMVVLKEERDDLEMVRGALETLLSALTPIGPAHGPTNEVLPSVMNSDLLSREPESIPLLLSLLSEDDFYVRYYTLQLLTALLTNSLNRLQEAILTVPRGITRLMDMLMDREVIRNEALLLLTYLTREAEEIQKIVVFEGAFEKIFSIIKEEGGSEGGVVVQDCLELLKNLLRNNPSNQILLKETVGFEPLISILKLRKGNVFGFTQQKTINLLSALGTIELLLMGGPEPELGKDANKQSIQTILAQYNILDHLLLLGVESKWAAVAVRCSALRCIGNLIVRHPRNLETFASKVIGEEPHVEPALNSILRIVLRTTDVEEFIAAEYIFKCFCEKNIDGQAMLASTMTQPLPVSKVTSEDNVSMPFGSMLLGAFTSSYSDGDLKTCCRAVSVLSHILKDNLHCKERALQVDLQAPVQSLGAPDPLMHRVVKYLAFASTKKKENDQENTKDGDTYVEPIFLRLLIIWLADCPSAVHSFLESPTHLTYLLELVSSPRASVSIRGLAAVLLGECVLYNNNSGDNSTDAFTVVDTISQKIGLTSYLLKFDEMKKTIFFTATTSAPNHKPLTRSSAASLEDIVQVDNDKINQKYEHPVLASIFSLQFVNFVKKLEVETRESIVEVFSHPKSKVQVVPAEMDQKDAESDPDYIKRLKLFMEKQCNEIQDLLGRNASLAEDLARTDRGDVSASNQKVSGGLERVQADTLRRDLQEAMQRVEILKSEKAQLEAEASMYRNLAGKLESDLKVLSDAYNSLEHANFQLDSEVKALRKGGNEPYPDVEAIREEAREEAQKESEAELNDLLVCLGQEQSKVERLSARLVELGEDVDSLLEGVGDDAGLPEGDVDEDEE